MNSITAGGQRVQHRSQPLAAAGNNVVGDLVDQHHVGGQPLADQRVDALHVGSGEVAHIGEVGGTAGVGWHWIHGHFKAEVYRRDYRAVRQIAWEPVAVNRDAAEMAGRRGFAISGSRANYEHLRFRGTVHRVPIRWHMKSSR
jgi:hypothetical protein